MHLKQFLTGSAIITCIIGLATSGQAHFGALIPADDIIGQEDSKKLELAVKFIHPMERHYMEMARPVQFGVLRNGRKTDLLATLSETKGRAPEQDRDYHCLADHLPDQAARRLYLLC